MKERTNMTPVRWGVILTLLSLAGVVVIFELGIRNGWTLALKISEISLLVMLMICFILSYMKTGIWSFSHKPIKELDEREMEMTSRTLRTSYGLFSVIVLILLFVFAVLEITFSVVLAASLLLFAHLIPGMMIAFKEKALRF